MWEFILKYWVEVLFSGIMTGITLLYRRYMKLYHAEQQRTQKEFKETFRQELQKDFSAEFEKFKERDNKFQTTFDNLNKQLEIITSGLLSVQRKTFEDDCKKLLDPHHNLTLDEYKQLVNDHEIYHALGGNHNGDRLFALVEQKLRQHIG